MKKFLSFLTPALFLGIYAQPADATPTWKCGKRHCFWVEGYTGPLPDFATNWGPPRQPGCYYAYGRLSKRWTEVCPPS